MEPDGNDHGFTKRVRGYNEEMRLFQTFINHSRFTNWGYKQTLKKHVCYITRDDMIWCDTIRSIQIEPNIRNTQEYQITLFQSMLQMSSNHNDKVRHIWTA